MIETRGVMEQAEALFAKRPSWVQFFREILGAEGLVRAIYTTDSERAEFEETPAHARLQQMVQELRALDGDVTPVPREPTRVITVRLPKSLHEALKTEAHENESSLNQLCIAKLLAPLATALRLHEQPHHPEAPTGSQP